MPNKINPEVNARAVRMVQDHQQDYPSVTAAAQAVAKQLGLGRETVRAVGWSMPRSTLVAAGCHVDGAGRDQKR